MRRFNINVLNAIYRDKDVRLAVCEELFPYFCYYYFPEFFTYNLAPFQWDLMYDLQRIGNGEVKEAGEIYFAEAGKTSFTKMLVVWCIVYNKKRYINWDSYTKANSENALFDVAVTLQTNKQIIEDFGQLYWEAKDNSKESRMKRLGSFLTENKVRVEAFSTGQSTRGRVYQQFRPDLFILDDIETSQTRESYAITYKIVEHIKEMRRGLASYGGIVFLGNYISEDGVIQYVIDSLKDRDNCVVRNVPVMDQQGILAWPDKFVHTKEEAMAVNNSIMDVQKKKVSIEVKREEIEDFEAEMMNNPSRAGDYIFDRDRIEQLQEKCREPVKNSAGFNMWADFNPSHRYGGGSDSSEGVGRDSCSSVFIDFTRVPALAVATFENNRIAPDVFADEIVREADLFGQPYFGPEINNSGWATVMRLLQIYPEEKVYRRVMKDKISGKPSNQFGFKTGSNKSEIIYNLKSAVEDGELEILDRSLLEELKYYKLRDLRDSGMSKEGMTRHFDKLMAAAIAWEMRHYTKAPKEGGRITKPVKQKPIGSISQYN